MPGGNNHKITSASVSCLTLVPFKMEHLTSDLVLVQLADVAADGLGSGAVQFVINYTALIQSNAKMGSTSAFWKSCG